MTAAADIQIAVLNNVSVIAVDFCTGGILTVNGGFAGVIRRGVVTVNLRAGAAVGDGALAFVITALSPSIWIPWTPDR
ncbi:putative membrane protein [Escherichia coli 2731150]|nr:putative membrane protein [Escherichia coli 2731150]